MSKKRKPKVSVPLLVVAAIALSWVVVMLWPSLVDRDASSEADDPKKLLTSDPNVPATPERSAAPVTSVTNVPAPRQPTDDSSDSAWSTYHGNAALTGAVETILPDKPAVLWRFQAGAPVYHTPVACGDRIYFSTAKGGVFALDLEGNEVWSKHLQREPKKDGSPRSERLDAPTACFESTVLVGSMGGTLYAFDASTGDEKWTYDMGGPILGSVNLHRSGRVFVIGQDDGSLHSIDLKTGRQVWQTESIDRCDGSPSVSEDAIVFGSCAAALHVFSASDGQLVRNIELDGDSQVAGGVALVGDSAFTGSHSGRVFHANIRTGEILWVNEDSEDEVLTTPTVAGDWVVFSSYDGRVYGLDRATGQQKWRFETDGWSHSPVIADDKVIVDSDGTLYFLRLSTGEEIWSYEVSDEITSPAIIQQMIVVGSEDGTITAFGEKQS